MLKILKLAGLVIGMLILLAILTIVLLITFVSPNRLKPVLTDQVMKTTGRELMIDGDLSWTLFPYFGIKVGHSSLGNPAGFNQKIFSEISTITMGVKILPLLDKRIESDGIVLNGMKLHLIKNKNGLANWAFNLPADMTKTGNTNTPATHKKMVMGLAISGIHITHSSMDYTDEQTQKYYAINHFELQANNINLQKSFPIQASFDVTTDGKKTPVTIKGDMNFDLNQQTLQCDNIRATVANLAMKGNLNITRLNTNPVINAELKLDSLQTATVRMTNVAVKAHFQKGILDIAPFSADFYQGTITGQTIVNLNASTPEITAHAKLTNVQAEPLINDLGGQNQKLKIAGLANLEMQVTTAGTAPKTLLQNLNGVSQFTFNNGALKGIDLGYLVDSAYALIKHQPMTATNTNQTNFGTLTGTAVIRSGVINNNDFVGDTPRFAIRGAGTIDLVNQKIDYALQTAIKQRADQKDNAMNLYGLTIPVLITGNLNNPGIRLDSGALAKALAEQQIKKVTNQTKEKIQEQIKKQLPGKAGDVLNKLLGN
ncbi:MAG TPA: AsmA family protein [Gammaproteobacteria bacterium]|nr:AsmA family protein [Gammaproteobacteria bacterium]